MDDTDDYLFTETTTPKQQVWMIGFFDVLGFSARVKTEGIDKIYKDYRKLLQNVLDGHAIETFGSIVPTLTGGSLFSAGGKVEINYTYFSDTILMWMPLLPTYPRLFLQRCADLMCESLLMGIPLRGAIAVGEGYMHKGTGIYLGEHIVDAARFESIQEQIGVAWTLSAAQSALLPSAHPSQFIEYYAPIKENTKHDPTEFWSPIALDWPRRWRDCNHRDLIRHLEQLRPDNESVTKYYNNAIKFVQWSELHNDWDGDVNKMADFRHLIPFEKVENKANLFPEQWTELRAQVRLVQDME